MASTVNLKEIIQNKKFDWLDAVYIGLFPAEIKGDTSQTIMLITESQNAPGTWGGDTFNSMDSELEVQIFYASDFAKNMDSIEIELMKYLQDSGYRVSNSRSHISDPDTGQVTKTMYFSYSQKI